MPPTLTPGTRLGPFEIVSSLGEGGMGAVYRARDTKLGRDVAIKVLLPAVANDPERLARFQREAQVLASLNHPHIAAIYGLESVRSGGSSDASAMALVLELVEGPTLADLIAARAAGSKDPALRTAGGGIPFEEALPIARQIAEALEAAHEQGIVHRDLKPANIKNREDGTVKVLDFGLAKALSPAAGPTPSMSQSPTMTTPAMTAAGMILGTAAYMSPEQARGKAVDKRADIWAFGVVLFEMLSGTRAFGGEDISEVLGSVLKLEPEWNALPADLPAPVRRLLKRCLEKDPKKRLRDLAEGLLQMEEALTTPAPSATIAARDVRALSRSTILMGVACLIVACGATGAFVWNLRPSPAPQPVSRLVVPLPPDERLLRSRSTIAFSPDGTQLAYIGGADTGRQIYTRALDTFEIKPLAGTAGAQDLFFSPEGQSIGFFAAGKLKKISVAGGAVQDVCESNVVGGTWGANDTIVFSAATGLSQVSAAGGEPRVLTTLKPGETGHRWPRFLPDGKTIFYAIVTGRSLEDTQIAVHRLDTGEDRILIRGGTSPAYAPSGHLVYYRAGTIMAVPFDGSRLELIGVPASVVEGVSFGLTGGGFSVSSRGSLAYEAGGVQSSKNTLVLVDRSGGEKPLPAPPREYDDISFSPDGQRVVAQITEDAQTGGVWVYDIPRGTLDRRTFDSSLTMPAWTADGSRILYSLSKPGASGLYWKLADGSGPEERMTTTDFSTGAASASRDALAYENRKDGDIWTFPFQGERKPAPFVQTPFYEGSPRFSPDGHWLAFNSNETGRAEIYVQPYPGPGGKVLVSTDGGSEPIWAHSGHELFYRDGEKMMVLDIQTQPVLKNGSPRMLFERKAFMDGSRQWDVALDDQHFLIVKGSEQAESALLHINIVQNWFEELKRLAPVKK